MPRSAVVTFLALLTVVAAVPGGVAVAEPSPTDGRVADRTVATNPAVAPQIGDTPSELAVTAYANGSARWQFTYRTPLANDSEREDFRAFADRFESGETGLFDSFRNRSTGLVAEAENVTGRPMNASAFGHDAYVDTAPMRDFGVVTLSFRWGGFAAVSGDRVVVGDVFEGGLYIGPGQRLVLRSGPDLAFASVSPSATQSDPDSLAESDSVTWTGERRFTDNRPRAVFTRADGVTSASTDAADGDGAGTDGDGLAPLVGGVLLAVGAAAVFLRRRATADGEPSPGRDDSSPESAAAQADDTGTEAAPTNEDAPTEDSAAAEAAPAVSNTELRSDEDRVIGLLKEHGGRMRQSRIVEETDWSKSKVSMLLSEMEEDGRLSKLRLGRENVVSLPGEGPIDDDEGS
jgi:hypothetical protein